MSAVRLLACTIGLSFALPGVAATDPYSSERLDLSIAASSHHVVDGLDYLDGNGVVSAGARYSHPDGLYAASQVLFGHGDGSLNPDEPLTALETVAGFNHFVGEHGFAVELRDYRFRPDGLGVEHYAGLGAHYRYGRFQAEVGVLKDQPIYSARLGRFFDYDARYLAMARSFRLGQRGEGVLALGAREVDGLDVAYQYVSLGYRRPWLGLDWEISYSRTSNETDHLYYPPPDRDVLQVRISRGFTIFSGRD